MKKQTFEEWVIEQDGKEIEKWRNAYFELQKRIDRAVEIIDIYTDGINLEAFDCLELMLKIEDVLKGEENE